ncbi:MAG TPA: response regulator, partial [Spirochaetota bacterium]|nr:response regulator [Spirochaetota bacterium]
KKHNGFIDVESKINVGTTFTIYLPATNKNIDDDIDKTIEIEHVSDCRILVMDDETIITTLLNKILTKYGYEVIISTDGEEAVSLYKKSLEENKKIDLVILDLTVPNGMGGKETMIELKKIDKEVKAIISSGYSNDSVINLVDEIGFAGYITKPYKIEDLIATINKAINNAKVN